MNINIQRLTSWDQLSDADRNMWDRLAADKPFCSRWWLQPWWNAYGKADELCLLIARQDEALVGLLPLYYGSSSAGRVLKLLGSGEVCSDYLTVLSDDQTQTVVTEAIADWLVTANGIAAERWDLLQLDNIAANDPAWQTIAGRFKSHEYQSHQTPALDTWRIELPSDWETYLGMLSKSHRKQVRRADRNFFENQQATHRICTGIDAINAFDRFVELHQKRRHMLGQAGCFHSEAFSSFLHDAVEAGSQQGSEVELHFIDVDGQPVSTELHLLGQDAAGNTTAYVYQSGLDPNQLELEPGRLMHIAVTRRAIEQGFAGLDFLRGDEPYKHHWRAEPITMMDLRIVPTHLSAILRHNLWTAGGTVKSWIKTGLTMTGMRS